MPSVSTTSLKIICLQKSIYFFQHCVKIFWLYLFLRRFLTRAITGFVNVYSWVERSADRVQCLSLQYNIVNWPVLYPDLYLSRGQFPLTFLPSRSQGMFGQFSRWQRIERDSLDRPPSWKNLTKKPWGRSWCLLAVFMWQHTRPRLPPPPPLKEISLGGSVARYPKERLRGTLPFVLIENMPPPLPCTSL